MNEKPVMSSNPTPVGPGAALPATLAPPPSPRNDERINILLVDDEPRNLTVLETILDDPRYQLVRAESGDQALLSLIACATLWSGS